MANRKILTSLFCPMIQKIKSQLMKEDRFQKTIIPNSQEQLRSILPKSKSCKIMMNLKKINPLRFRYKRQTRKKKNVHNLWMKKIWSRKINVNKPKAKKSDSKYQMLKNLKSLKTIKRMIKMRCNKAVIPFIQKDLHLRQKTNYNAKQYIWKSEIHLWKTSMVEKMRSYNKLKINI